MRSSIRSRLVALIRGQWAGLLALFLVIAGGTAYAANTVLSSDIVDGEVKTADIGNNQIRSVDLRNDTLSGGGLQSSDIAPGAITAADVAGESLTGDEVADESLTVSDITDESLTGDVVASDTLTGSDVLESSLGVVPDADRVDGRHVCQGEASAGTSFTTLCAAGGLIVEGACTPVSDQLASGVARLRTTQANNAFYVINGPVNSSDANFRSADGPVTLVSQDGGGAGAVSPTITHFHASSQTGQLTGSIAVRVASFTPTLASCEFTMDILG